MTSDRELEDYDPADLCLALCRMVSYNIGHLAYLNAKRYNLRRIFFGGFFIRGHPYTMETLSFAIKFWSKVCSCLACLFVGCVRVRACWTCRANVGPTILPVTDFYPLIILLEPQDTFKGEQG